MLGQIGIECGGPFDAAAVMLDDRFEVFKSAIVHVGGGQLDVAQRGHGEFSLIPFFPSNEETAKVFGFRIEPVVGEGLALEQRTAMAMEAIGAKLLAAWIVFGVE